MRNFLRSGYGILLILLLITNFLNGGLSDPKSYFFNMLLSLPGIIIGVSFHEFAHAWTSYKFGDPTPMRQGRVTVSPRAHFDPAGFLCLLFCGFGWGVPVQIDSRYYKHPRADELVVSAAGVVMNFIIAVIFSFIAHLMIGADASVAGLGGSALDIIFTMVLYTVMINLTLLVFNLIPVPPLDGFGVLTNLFNFRKYGWYMKFYNAGPMLLMFLLLFGVVDRILSPAVQGLYGLLLNSIIM